MQREVVTDHFTDLVKGGLDTAGPVGRQEEVLHPASTRIGWHRLNRPNVYRGAEPTRLHTVEQGVKVDHRSPANQDEATSRGQPVQPLRTEEALVLARYAGQDEHKL